jgi:tetratricopeptide (TPR) repeat protein
VSSDKRQILPEKITSPIQFLAACLVLLIVVETAFLGAAATIRQPDWAPGLLVICAVLLVPGVLLALFRLYTKHRPELLADDSYLRHQQALSESAAKLGDELQKVGFGLEDVANRGSVRPLNTHHSEIIDDQLGNVLQHLPNVTERANSVQIAPNVLRQTAEGLLARRRWTEAAHYLDEYCKAMPDDWEAQFSRGLAHANSREGAGSDLASLRAYGEAIALAPIDLDPEMRAKLFSYRGAMAKRLRRFAEAEADLTMAEGLTQREDRLRDIDYNLAGVYALSNRKDEALARLRRLRGSPLLLSVAGHASDYFLNLVDDPEFTSLIAGPGAT